MTVNAGIVTTVPIKYNKANRKLIARTLDFTASGINTSTALTGIPDTIEIVNHEMHNWSKSYSYIIQPNGWFS